MRRLGIPLGVFCSLLSCVAARCLAQEAPPSTASTSSAANPASGQGTPNQTAGTQDLQRAVQNPVASMIIVPVQNNTNFGIGPFARTQNVMNIQPLIPIQATANWKLTIRWIAPIIWQPASGTANLEVYGIEEATPAYFATQPLQKSAGVYGFGDMTPTFFFAPRKPRKLIWGVGPYFILPTATSRDLGQGKLSIGPSVVVLVQPGPWTIGALVNNAWSVAGSGGRRPVNQMSLQYFLNYNLKSGWYIPLSPIITANWKASDGSVWTVPVGGGVGRVMRVGAQPMNISAQFYRNAERPSNGSTWSMRIQIAFLFPMTPSHP